MITNDGKEIISKYILGQAPAFATHIALGCGTKPKATLPKTIVSNAGTLAYVLLNVVTLTTSTPHGFRVGDVVTISGLNTVTGANTTVYDISFVNDSFTISAVTSTTFSFKYVHGAIPYGTLNAQSGKTMSVSKDYVNKPNLDFEMIRIPISSRGYVNESGVSKLAFAAEMPTVERFEITEVALWSAGSNSNAQNMDSRALSSFARSEKWKLHSGSSVNEIPYYAIISAQSVGDINLDLGKIFYAPADSPLKFFAERQARYEGARYLNDTIMLRGDSCKILDSGLPDYTWTDASNSNDPAKHIHLDGASIDLSKNSPNDEIRLAFSVMSVSVSNDTPPTSVRIYMDFLHSEGDVTTGYARFKGTVAQSELIDNRYYVMKIKLGDLETSADFSWSKLRVIRIFASCEVVTNSVSAPNSNYYVALDALRFENTSTPNPLYAMTGYSLIDDGTTTPKPIYKLSNTSNYIEFRFSLGVS